MACTQQQHRRGPDSILTSSVHVSDVRERERFISLQQHLTMAFTALLIWSHLPACFFFPASASRNFQVGRFDICCCSKHIESKSCTLLTAKAATTCCLGTFSVLNRDIRWSLPVLSGLYLTPTSQMHSKSNTSKEWTYIETLKCPRQ